MTTNISNLKRATAIAAILLVSVGLSACNKGQAWIASVDGQKISGENFAEGVGYFSELQGGVEPTAGADNGVIPTAVASQYVLFQVQQVFLDRLAEENDVVPSDEEIDAIRKELIGSEGGEALGTTPEWFQTEIATFSATYNAVIDFYGSGIDQTEQAKAIYEQTKGQYTNFCVDLIAREDQASAEAAHKRITDGEDFAAVAKDVASETIPAAGDAQDGYLGCQPATNINQYLGGEIFMTMADAGDGDLLPVAESEGVYYVLRLRKREVPPFEEVEAGIRSQMGAPGEQEAIQALNELMETSDIELNPKFGSWSSTTGYTPPVGATHTEPPVDPRLSVAPIG